MAVSRYNVPNPLPEQPVEIAKGIRAWTNRNGVTAVLLHHSSDPDTASLKDRRLSVPGDEARFLRENELDFSTWAGKAVYPEYDSKLHEDSNIGYVKDRPVWVGLDFGYHHPAAVFAQIGPEVWVIGEVMGEDMTLERFMHDVFIPYRDRLFPSDTKWLYAADPAGKQVSDKSEHTSFSLLSNLGIYPMQKKSEINEGLTLIRQRLHLGLLKVHPRCRVLIEGLSGAYRYPEPTAGRPEPAFPLKDGYYDHLQDALRYLAVNSMSLFTPKPQEKPKEKSWVRRIVEREYDDDLSLLSG